MLASATWGSPAEALGDPLDGRLDGAGVHPADEAEGEEVLGALGVTRLDPGLLADLLGDGGHGDLVDRVGGQRAVGQRVGLVAGLGQVPLLEGVAVDDQDGPLGHQVDVGLEGGRVHGHEHVGRVARGEDVVVRDVDLEGRHPVDRAGRGPDLGREVREGGQVVAQQGAAGREAVAGQLHAVAGVPGEAHDDLVQLLGVLRSRCHGLPRLLSWTLESPASLRCVSPRRASLRRRHPRGAPRTPSDVSFGLTLLPPAQNPPASQVGRGVPSGLVPAAGARPPPSGDQAAPRPASGGAVTQAVGLRRW